MIPAATIERLASYRRWLREMQASGSSRVYSHQLAAITRFSPAQVRRDLMLIGFGGSPARGYDVAGLIQRIGELLDPLAGEVIAIVGVGHLGRALLNYLTHRDPRPIAVITFDLDPQKVGRMIHGCPCFNISELVAIAADRQIFTAVLTVPKEAAQDVTDQLIRAGVRGILNFAPVRLRVPPDVFVEDVDIAALLEKVEFFARCRPTWKEARA